MIDDQTKTIEQQKRQEEREKWEDFEHERLEHEKDYKDLSDLVRYLSLAGMDDLATRLWDMRFAFQKPRKSDFIKREIDIRSRRQELAGKKTTKKEYKEIKKQVVRLTKKVTRVAKKHKDFYNLYRLAADIIDDMIYHGILDKNRNVLSHDGVHQYFNRPRMHGYGRYNNEDNYGYAKLAFYRDYKSEFNEELRNHRI